MERATTIKALAGLRLAVGVGAWATPRVAGTLFGLDSEGNPQAPYLARLFGVRDVALGWGTFTTEGDAQRRWLQAGLACDLADAAAGVAGGRAGYLPAVSAAMVTATALVASALGAKLLSEPGPTAA